MSTGVPNCGPEQRGGKKIGVDGVRRVRSYGRMRKSIGSGTQSSIFVSLLAVTLVVACGGPSAEASEPVAEVASTGAASTDAVSDNASLEAEPQTTITCSCTACTTVSHCTVRTPGACHTETWTVSIPNSCNYNRPINCCP